MSNNQDNLKRLKGADRIRKQVNVMLGSNDIQGVQQGVFEVVSNSIDRFRRGFGDHIEVIKNKDLSYEVIDYADGLPMDWNEDEKAYNWELATRVLYAGGNYDKDSESLGQHGLGLGSTLMSSKYAKVISNRNGNTYQIEMVEGRPINKLDGTFICDDDDDLFTKKDGEKVLLTSNNELCKKGTYVKWIPDQSIFTNTDIPIEWINDKIKKQAIINKGLTIKVIDNCENKEYTHIYENGIMDYIKELSNKKELLDIIRFEDSGSGKDGEDKPVYDYRYEFVFTLNNEFKATEYYHNSSELLHGGSTADAIKKALVDTIHDFCNKNNLYKKGEKKIKYSDVEDSLLCVISSFSNRTSFTNQTKLAINNEFIKQFTAKSIYDKLTVYFIENLNDAKKICNQCLINKRASEKSEKARLNLKKKLSEDITIFNKPQGLLDCKSKDTSINRLFIAEGQSAKSGLAMGRNEETDAIYGIRGKILSCLKADESKIFSNDTVLNIIRILGCGVELKSNKNKEFYTFDINKLKYGKIIFGTDNDVDGLNIRCLLLTMFYRLMPTLITEGKVYYAESPLFEVLDVKDNVTYYAVDEKEKNEILSKLTGKKIEISRNKGIGELSQEVTAETIMNPNYEGLYQITMDDVEKANEYFELFMGSSVAPRREYIMEHFDEYCHESL